MTIKAYTGSKNPKIVIVGEAWGQSENLLKLPFVGEAGKELFRLLGEAFPEVEPQLHHKISNTFNYGLAWIKQRNEWFNAADIGLTNVFNLQPANNKIESLCQSKKELENKIPGNLPEILDGKYIKEEYLPELTRLEEELLELKPNLIILLGNTACWAVLKSTRISKIRGAIQESRFGKVLPTYHPAWVLRNWHGRPILLADLMKAQREAQFEEIRKPKREIIIKPTITEVIGWVDNTLQFEQDKILSTDIETASGQITMIGFSINESMAIVIPFSNPESLDGNYWQTIEEEIEAWHQVELLLKSNLPKLFQNGMYDLQYITRMGLKINMSPQSCDTMLLSHALFPEMQKDLGFLGSIYTNESSWKLLRTRKFDTVKKGE